jgi:hypothetical protein
MRNEVKKTFLLYLKPFLMAELKAVNPKIQIHCFETLVSALESFNKIAKIRSMPSKVKIQEIKKEDSKVSWGTMKAFQELQDSDLMKSIRKMQALSESVKMAQGIPNIYKQSSIEGIENFLRSMRGFPGNDDN